MVRDLRFWKGSVMLCVGGMKDVKCLPSFFHQIS